MSTFLATSVPQTQYPSSNRMIHDSTLMYSYDHHLFDLEGLPDYIVDQPADDSTSSFDPSQSQTLVSQEFLSSQNSLSSINGEPRKTHMQGLVNY